MDDIKCDSLVLHEEDTKTDIDLVDFNDYI